MNETQTQIYIQYFVPNGTASLKRSFFPGLDNEHFRKWKTWPQKWQAIFARVNKSEWKMRQMVRLVESKWFRCQRMDAMSFAFHLVHYISVAPQCSSVDQQKGVNARFHSYLLQLSSFLFLMLLLLLQMRLWLRLFNTKCPQCLCVY